MSVAWPLEINLSCVWDKTAQNFNLGSYIIPPPFPLKTLLYVAFEKNHNLPKRYVYVLKKSTENHIFKVKTRDFDNTIFFKVVESIEAQ